MIEVVLYTKAGCGLCEEVKELLKELAFSYPHQLKEVDITQDPTLHRKYA
ncbi:MAG: glutaredoxin family protein, partial [Chloroflexi bacterium]